MSKSIKVILILLVLVNLLFLGLGIYLKNFMFFTLSIVFLSTIAVIGIVIGGYAFLIYGLPSIHRNRDSLLSIIVYGIIYLKPPDIEKLKTEKNIKKLIRSLGYNRDARVQQAATNALVEMGEIVDRELKRAMNGSWLMPMRVSIGAAEVLLRIDFQRTLEHMGKCLKYPDERSAKISHETLTRIGEGAVEPLLRGYGGETSRYYPDTPDDLLIPVLLAIGEPAKEILFAIVKKREFSDYPPQIINALGEFKDIRTIDLLVDLLESTLNETWSSVRLLYERTLDVLTKIGVKEKEPLARIERIEAIWNVRQEEADLRSRFPEEWLDNSRHRAALRSIRMSPNIIGRNCGYNEYGTCMFRVREMNDLSFGPEGCSYQSDASGTYEPLGVKVCGKCHKRVRPCSKPGSTCPHCDAYWGHMVLKTT